MSYSHVGFIPPRIRKAGTSLRKILRRSGVRIPMSGLGATTVFPSATSIDAVAIRDAQIYHALYFGSDGQVSPASSKLGIVKKGTRVHFVRTDGRKFELSTGGWVLPQDFQNASAAAPPTAPLISAAPSPSWPWPRATMIAVGAAAAIAVALVVTRGRR